jgi:hypothetical protein
MKTEVKRGVCPGEKKKKKQKTTSACQISVSFWCNWMGTLCTPNFKTLYYQPKNENKKTVSHPVLVLW